jgi:tetratricopeptide (TPR) repeat protein
MVLVLLVFCTTLSWNRNTVWGGNEIDFWKSNSAVAERALRPQYWLGIVSFKNRKFDVAEKAFGELLTLGNLPVLRATGEALYFADNEKEAFELFGRLDAQSPGENSLDVFSAYTAAKNGQWRLMEELLNKGQAKDSDDMRIPWLRATIAKEQKDNLNAAIFSQKVLAAWEKMNTLSSSRLNEIGYVEWARNLREDSLPHLTNWLTEQGRLIAENPSDVKLRSDFGGQLLQLGLYDRAREQYANAVRLAPKAWSLYYNLGIVSDKQNDFGLSLGYYERALALSPGNMLVLANLASTAFVEKKYRKAENLYREITVNSPLNGKAWYALGRAQELMHNYSEAKLSYERAARLPNYSLKAEQSLKRLAAKPSESLMTLNHK